MDAVTALNHATTLRTNILGKDKQEKVNSIVVLAKLLDCIIGSEAVSNDFALILDHTLCNTLFSIVSANMSTETYKAILKIAVILILGSIFKTKDTGIDKYLPLFESLIEYLDVMDIITQKLYLQDNKITYNSIKLVNELITRALQFNYSGIITLAGRLKHVTFFSTVGNLIETQDKAIMDAIEVLKVSYYDLNEYLDATMFDLSIKSHQVMLNNLFLFLEVSLNEYGTPATVDEYVKAGFTDNPRQFVVENFSILLAMDLKIFLKDPNFTFKKRFHEELMMSDHNRTFPLYLFIRKCTELWIDTFHKRDRYPHLYDSILSWEIMIYFTMNNCLILWQETLAQLESEHDVDRIMELLASNIQTLENDLARGQKTIEETVDITASTSVVDMRHEQVERLKDAHVELWKQRFSEFFRELSKEVFGFVAEQRVIQLLKGSWVFTEQHGETLVNNRDKNSSGYKYYFLVLSPNRKSIYYKEYVEKALATPSYEEMERQFIPLSEIVDFRSTKIGDPVGAEDKKKNSMLISIKGTISYEKITLLGAGGKKLLSFYTDTQVSKYVWLDGLKMLKGYSKKGELSEDTEKQIDFLIDIRRNTQLLPLEMNRVEVDPELDAVDEDEIYSLTELMAATDPEGFHYR